MDAKKNPKSDLRRYSGLFLETGFVIALVAVLVALNYSFGEKSYVDLGVVDFVDPDPIMIEVVRTEIEKPVPPAPKVAEVFRIIDSDDVEIEDMVIEDVEATEDTRFEIVFRPDELDDPDDDPVYTFVPQKPQFPGGIEALFDFISRNVVYPQSAKENGIVGKVIVQFVVNKKGKVEKVQVVRGVDPILDQQAIKVVEKLPDWTPGEQNGKAVSVYYTLPISFKLN